MKNIDKDSLMILYAAQFVEPTSHGSGYLYRFLKGYESHNFTPETADYKLLLAEIAEQKGIDPKSIKVTIKRNLQKGWSPERAEVWERHTGWARGTPPRVGEAIRLVCESFDGVIRKSTIKET